MNGVSWCVCVVCAQGGHGRKATGDHDFPREVVGDERSTRAHMRKEPPKQQHRQPPGHHLALEQSYSTFLNKNKNRLKDEWKEIGWANMRKP